MSNERRVAGAKSPRAHGQQLQESPSGNVGKSGWPGQSGACPDGDAGPSPGARRLCPGHPTLRGVLDILSEIHLKKLLRPGQKVLVPQSRDQPPSGARSAPPDRDRLAQVLKSKVRLLGRDRRLEAPARRGP